MGSHLDRNKENAELSFALRSLLNDNQYLKNKEAAVFALGV